MGFNQLHWLDIAEYIAIALTVVSLLLAIALNLPLVALFFVTLSLLLNIINRLRFQYLYKKRFDHRMRQMQRQWHDSLEEITAKLAIPPPSPQPPKVIQPSSISLFRENLVLLEQAVNGIVQYINNHALRERLDRLEQAYAQLTAEKLSEPLSFANDPLNPCEADSKPPVIPSQKPLNTINLPPVTPPPSVPRWSCWHIFKEHSEAVSSLALSPDGQLLASVSWDQTLRIWDLIAGNLLATLVGHSQGVLTVVFTGENPYTLATGSFDQTIKLWSLGMEDGEGLKIELNQTFTAHTGSVHALATVFDHNLLISGSYDQTVKQWDLHNRKMIASSLDSLGAIYAIAVSSESKLIASAGGDGKVVLWEMINGKQIGILGGNVSSVESLAVSPDGQIVAAGCVDGTIKLWQLDPSLFSDTKSLPPIRVLSAHRGQVHAVLFSPVDQLLFSSGSDGQIQIWHPGNKQAIDVLTLNDSLLKNENASSPNHCNGVFCLALSNDGQILVAGGVDGTIKVWQRET